jgi:hypothetical protein
MRRIEVNELLKKRGWTKTELACYWGVSIQWISALLKKQASDKYVECAFRGLPNREAVEIKLEGRYLPVIKNKSSIETYAVGDVFEAESDSVVPSGSRAILTSKEGRGLSMIYTLNFEGQTLRLDRKLMDQHFAHVPAAA